MNKLQQKIQEHLSDKHIFIKNNNAQKTLVLFSSNGIYRNEDEFDKMIAADRYEWKNITKKFKCNLIFVRDIQKFWYLNGISNELNSIEAIYGELKKLTEGKEIITCGTSSGGFAAILFGNLLNAKHILAFSAQFDLTLFNIDFTKYDINSINLKKMLNHSDIPIFYICPIYSLQDKEQYENIKHIPTVKSFIIKNDGHGYHPYSHSIKKLLSFDTENLLQLYERQKNKQISPLEFDILISGYYILIKIFFRILRRTVRNCLKKLFCR